MTKQVHQTFLWPFLLLFLCLALPSQAQAQEEDTAPVGLFPASTTEAPEHALDPSEPTHPMIRLTPEKSEIVTVDTPVKSLIVGNPLHLNVMLDSAKRLILVGREPGATYFTALDKDGNIIMQRYVIIASPKEQYVRVRRTCANSTEGECAPTSVYFCPDMCHSTAILGAALDNGGGAGAGGSQGGGAAPAGGPAAGPAAAPNPSALNGE